jgi:hypothetical protein
MSLTKLFLAGNNIPGQEEFGKWLGTGKPLTFFTV